jgi:hypothetical protein
MSGGVERVLVKPAGDTRGADTECCGDTGDSAPCETGPAGRGQTGEAVSISLERSLASDVEGNEGEVVVGHGVVSRVEDLAWVSSVSVGDRQPSFRGCRHRS